MTDNSDEYRGLEGNRRTTQIAFALLYLGLTLIIVLSAIWTGIAVADRIVRPIRLLIGAADEVATGNLDVTVPVRASDGDVGSLGDTFNKMLQELKSQRNEILAGQGSGGRAPPLFRSRAVRRHRWRHRRRRDRHDHHCQSARPNRCWRSRRDVARQQSFGGAAAYRPRLRDRSRFQARRLSRAGDVLPRRRGADLQRPGHGRRNRNEAEENSYVVTVDDITDLVSASARPPGPTSRAASPTRSRIR